MRAAVLALLLGSCTTERVEFSSIDDLRAALTSNQTVVNASLTPGTYRIGTPLIVHGKTLSLHSNVAMLDAEEKCRHFIVQGVATLHLEGVALHNGRAKAAGGAILARRGATVRLRDVAIENCTAVSETTVDSGRARGGGIAISEDVDGALLELSSSSNHTHWVRAVAVSPDGNRIASGSADETIKVWDANDVAGGPLAKGVGHTDRVTGVAWSPDGLKLVSGSADDTIRIWDVDTLDGGPIAPIILSSSVNSVAFSPDGSRVACGSYDGKVRVYNASDGTLLTHGSSNGDSINSVSFSPSGTHIASGGSDDTVRVWATDNMTGGPLATGLGHSGRVNAVAWSPDSERVVSGSDDHTMKIWNASNMDAGALLLLTTGIQSFDIDAVAWSPQGDRVASGSADKLVKVWLASAVDQGPIATGSGHLNSVGAISWWPDGSRIVSGDGGFGEFNDFTMKVWDASDVRAGPLATGNHDGAVHSVAWSKGDRIVSGSADGSIHVWNADAVAAGPLDTRSESISVLAVALSPDGGLVASTTITGSGSYIKTWKVSDEDGSLDLISQDWINGEWVSCLTWSMDGTRIASNRYDGEVVIWNVSNLEAGPVATSEHHAGTVSAVAWSPDGTRIASGSGQSDGTLHVLDASNVEADPLATGSIQISINCLSWSPDGSRIATGSGDSFASTGDLGVWDVSNLDQGPLVTGSDHSNAVQSVAFSPDGSRIASGSADLTVRLWDATDVGMGSLATGRHSSGVTALAWSPDGSRLVSSSNDGTIKVWLLTFVHALSLERVVVSGCSASATSSHGGGIAAQGSSTVLHLWSLVAQNSSFTANTADTQGGALALTSDAHAETNKAVLEGCSFAANSAGDGQGGALAADGATFAVEGCAFDGNRAADGAAIYYGRAFSTVPLSTVRVSRFTANTPDPTVRANARIAWTCQPGQYMPQIGTGRGDFDGCMSCIEGYYGGAASNHTEPTCYERCKAGSFCPEGSVEPRKCFAGSYLASTGASSNDSCISCASGRFGVTLGATACEACSAGKYTDATGETECTPCPEGGYCKDEGADTSMVFQRCPAGTWSAEIAANSSRTCTNCSAGTYLPETGATSDAQCKPCRKGSFCPAGSPEPTECAVGRFMDATSATACYACTPGAVCEKGASSPLPCGAGTFSGATGLGSSVQCEGCPPGAFCFAGALHPTNCSAGTYAEQERSELCLGCDEGKYQARGGATACDACGQGYTCPQGSVVRIPATCREGTYLNRTDACVECPPGTACIGGAAQPRNCSVGSFQDGVGQSKCVDCEAGTFQPERGQTACAECAAGTLCGPGASTALPCPSGLHQNATLTALGIPMTSLDDCIACPAGAFCPVGSAHPSACAPGSYQGAEEAASCNRCAAGRYQEEEGATACKECTLHSWCAAGSSAATPCDEGKVGTATGLQGPDECDACPPGAWCSTGASFPCAEGTWLDQPGATNRSACRSCPEHATTLREGSTAVADCVCDAGFLLTTNDAGAAICDACPLPGTNCSERGVSLASLPLAPMYWRSRESSTDPRLCPTYANVPGEKRCVGGNAACAGLLSGVYCTACPSETYLDRSGACLECAELSTTAILIVAALAVLVAGLLLLLLCSTRLSRALGRSSAARRASALAEASGLAAKAKQLISFYQMATSVQTAFGVTFPAEVRAVLSFFSVFSLNLFEFGLPVECMGLGSFLQRLTFMLLAPLCLLLCALPLAWWLLREEEGLTRGLTRSGGAVLLRALPMALRVLFIVFPLTSAVAVQAYDCEGFDDGTYWLRADLSLQCGWGDGSGLAERTAEYKRVRAAASVAVALYPIGVPLFFLALLLACRKQLSRQAPATPLSASLGFICGEYRKRWFVWEVLESARKLFFVSLVRLVSPGTLSQLLVALVVALSLLVFQLSAAPYKRHTDNFLALLSCTSYILLLLGALTLKLGALTEALDGQLSLQLRYIFGVPVTPVLVVLIGSTLAAITFAAAVAAREGVRDMRQPKLRYAGSGALVALPLPPGKTHHLFVSHVWGSAQDQARVLRSRLQAVVSGLRVWLDVEDLEDISALEEAVDASQAVLVLVSSGYFQSKNCMRELVRCVATNKPLIAVAERDSAHGGLTEAEAREQCLSSGAKFESWGFDTSAPSAAALADALLGPAGETGAGAVVVRRLSHAAPPAADKPIPYERIGAFQQAMLRLIVQRLVPAREMYLPGELGAGQKKPALSPPARRFHLWLSRHNPGARELLEELERKCGWQGRLLVTDDPAQLAEADQLLLRLDRATWADDGARKDALAAEVRSPLEGSPRRGLLLVHETDPGRGGVEAFDHFFGSAQTPPELLQLGIYKEVAVPMKAEPYRATSLALLVGFFSADNERARGCCSPGHVGKASAAPAGVVARVAARAQEVRLMRRESSRSRASGKGGVAPSLSPLSSAEASEPSSPGRASSPSKRRFSGWRSKASSYGASLGEGGEPSRSKASPGAGAGPSSPVRVETPPRMPSQAGRGGTPEL